MRAFTTILCILLSIYSAQAQGIKLSYINNQPGGWNTPANWIQLNAPAGQPPIQRVPTELDDVVIKTNLSIDFDAVNNHLEVGGKATTGYRCKSMHVSQANVILTAPFPDQGGLVEVWTGNGGYVLVDASSNIMRGIFRLHGGDSSKADLQIINSRMGELFSHANWSGVIVDTLGSARFINSELAGFTYATGPVGGSIYAENCNFKLTHFQVGDNGKGTLINCNFTNDGNNVSMRFLIGRAASFISQNLNITSYMQQTIYTSGHILQANLRCVYPTGDFIFSQADPAKPLPNIIDGNISFQEKKVNFQGDLKLSGNFNHSTPPDLFYDDSTHISINNKDVLTYGGSPKKVFSLEFFGDKNSTFNWPLGFKVDTLIINKSNCAKVNFVNPLYVKGETRIKRGQLVLNPIDTVPYHLICDGDLNIFPGGGLFLRKNDNGAVAGIAVNGNIIDSNTVADTLCTGLSNPYGGDITLYRRPANSKSSTISIAGNSNIGNLSLIGSNGSTVSMGSSLSVKNFSFINPGYLVLGNNNLNVTGVVTNFGADRFFITNDTGKLKINNIVNLPITFPVGTAAGSYNPVIIQNAGVPDQFAVNVKPNVLTGGSTGQVLTSGVVNKTWFIEEAVPGGSDATLTVQWNASDELQNFLRTAAFLSHHTAGNWSNGLKLSADGTNPYTLTRTKLAGFSPFAVVDATSAVPLKLVSFTGKYNNQNIDLYWITEDEMNTQSYSVEKSEDGTVFKTLSAMPASGATTGQNNYTYTDSFATKNVNHYRLKILGKDGKLTYSETITVRLPPKELFTFYPNPANDRIFITRFNTIAACTITVLDAKGLLVSIHRINAGLGSAFINVGNLSAGVYHILVETDVSKEVQQFLKR